jgi:hypothetical protein
MEIRFSPYNSPFIPSGESPDIYWIGLEFKHMPHSAHVHRWIQWQGEEHARVLQLEITSAIAVLPWLDEMAADGVAAAGRRARAIRQFLAPNKKFVGDRKKLLAKKTVSAQV